MTPWERSSKENISQMVNEVCKKVGTRCFPRESRIDEEGMDVHPQPSKVRERIHEPPSYSSGQNEEESLRTIEYYSKTLSTVDMDQRESIDGCLNCKGVPINVFSHLYVGDIEITFEDVAASQISHEHKYEEIVATNEEPRSTYPSPLEFQEVDQIKQKEEEEVRFHEPSLIEVSLNMSERDIQEAVSILHDTQELVSISCWEFSSLEGPSFLEYMEKIQRAMCNIKGNFMSLIFDRKNVIELSERLHES